MDNITEFQNYIRLVVKKPIKKIWEKMFLNVVTKIGPSSIIRPVHVLDEFGSSKQIHLRSYKIDDDFIYEIPLVRNLEEKESEEIIKMWVKFYKEGDFLIETSTPYIDDETVADDSDDLISCCEKAKLKHNKWMRNKIKEGYRFGFVYSEKEKTHPMLRPWDDLPSQYKQMDESSIIGNILKLKEAKQFTDPDEVLLGLKEKDPTTIKFAQSVGMPPAVISQYGELAQQMDQQDVPRKIKIAFLNAEEEIIDFIEKKISQVTKGLNKNISRRDLFRGVGNFAAIVSQLSNISSMMQALPKTSDNMMPGYERKTYVDWMSDDKVLEFLPYRLHEEFLNLFTSGSLSKEKYILQINEWFNSYSLPWRATDMKEGDDNFIWKLTRTKAEEEEKLDTFPGHWDDVDTDGYWDSEDFEGGEGWENYDNEDMPNPRHFEKMNKELKKQGKTLVWGWSGGDPGMGGASKIFKSK